MTYEKYAKNQNIYKVIAWIFLSIAAISFTSCVSKKDTTPPTIPTNITAEAISPSAIKLMWNASTDNVGISGYKIYRDGIYIKGAFSNFTTIIIDNLLPQTQYCYTVTAVDWSVNESGHSSIACATTPEDTEPPTIPANITVYYSVSEEQGSFNIHWSSASDNGAVAGYKVYRDGAYIGDAKGTSYSDNNLTGVTTYCYAVSAYDMAGNESQVSESFCATSSWRLEQIIYGRYGNFNDVSLDTDSQGYAHVCYMDLTFDLNSKPPVIIRDLYYVNNKNGPWNTMDIRMIDTVSYPDQGEDMSTSLKIDSSDNVHIVYSFPYSSAGLKYWTNNSSIPETIDNSNYIFHADLDIDNNDAAHIIYLDGNSYKYATNKSGSWIIETVESLTVYAPGTTSIVLDGNGSAHIAYFDYGNSELKYVTNRSGTWQIDAVDTDGNLGRFPSIALDSVGYVHISYLDVNNTVLKYVTNKSGFWVSATFTEPTQNAQYSSIAVDAFDNVHISYTGNSDSDSNLYEYSNFSGSWKTYMIDAFSSSYRPEITIDQENYTHIGYKRSGDVRYATNRP
jgi:chitodextrinase